MGTQVFRDHVAMPWPNGAGITYEVTRSPATGDFDWRISLADIDNDGPFSVLEGVDRWIVLMEGEYMILADGETTHRIEEHVPFFFPGEIAFDCTLGFGQARDLNIMTRRGNVDSNVRVLTEGSHDIDAGTNDINIFVGLTGETEVEEETLEYRDAAIITGNQLVTTTGSFAHILLRTI